MLHKPRLLSVLRRLRVVGLISVQQAVRFAVLRVSVLCLHGVQLSSTAGKNSPPSGKGPCFSNLRVIWSRFVKGTGGQSL